MSVPVNADDRGFRSEPDPENPGWFTWQLNDSTRFNSWMFPKLLVRADSDGKARLRMFPEHRHTNLGNNIHGGTVMALIDIALFACARQLGIIEAGTAVTLDLSVQFIGAGGKVLQETVTNTAVYEVQGNEKYVRAKVAESNGNYAWTQPVRVP